MNLPDPQECVAILAALEIAHAAQTRKPEIEATQQPSRWRAAGRSYGTFEAERRP